MDRRDKIIYYLLIVALTVFTLTLLFIKNYFFAILALILDGALVFYFVTKLSNNKDDVSRYNSELKNILKTYDSVLVEITELPSFETNNVVSITNFKDLLDAQYEIRKPIFFKQYDKSCAFLLIDVNQICIFILKLSKDVVNPLEKYCNYSYDDKVLINFFDKIEMPSIVCFGGNKKYRISPVLDSHLDPVDKDSYINEIVDNNLNDHNKITDVGINNNQDVNFPNKVLSQQDLLNELPELRK